ncbi:MAG TPA: hypothetical protein VKF62_14330, partial [Planctomycetota bacterium]|nr:hypothetical protein [Planctomycetota bacterium]
LNSGLGPASPATCNLVFTVTAPSILFISSTPALLMVGVSNPALNLGPAGFPGCTLLTSAEVLLPLPAAGVPPIHSSTVAIPPNPAFVGVTVYTQALAMPAGLVGPQPTLSNGIAVSL